MFKCLFIYKSMTAAQYAANILRVNGISVSLTKAPRDMVTTSCSHAVVCESRYLDFSLKILSQRSAYPDRVLTDFSGGNG